MIHAKHIRRSVAGLLAIGAVAIGCTFSENQFPLPLSATDAPKAWSPILQCAQQRGLKVQDERKTNHVNVWMDASNQLEISYTVRGDHVDMDVVIWGDVSDDDKKKIVAKLKAQGLEIWDCAQKLGLDGPPPAAPTAAAPVTSGSAAGSTSATPPP